MSYYGRRNYGGGAPVRVSGMVSAESVIWALKGQNPSPDYVKAVLMNYIDLKFARGKTKVEVAWKLEYLERELMEYADDFRRIREMYNLGPSRIIALRQRNGLSRSSSHQPTPLLHRPNQVVTRVNTTRPVSSTTATPSRPLPQDEEEPPPPPYAADDPEPDQTRMLEARLAAEAEASGRLQRDATPTQAVSNTATTNEQRFSPPAGPPPGSSHPAPAISSPPARPERTSMEIPEESPADDQVRLVWEESQLDEAKRASRAAEQEREELEEALRLSLAEAEAAGVASSVAGPSSMPSQSSRPMPEPAAPVPPTQPVSSAQPVQPTSPAQPRSPRPLPRPNTGSPRAVPQPPFQPNLGSPMSPAGNGQPNFYASPTFPPEHRRSVSDVGYQSPSHQQQQFNSAFNAMTLSPGSQPQPFNPMDDDDDAMSSVPALQPMKTGTVIQSRNPFLSPTEAAQDPSASVPSPFPVDPARKPLPPSPGDTATTEAQYQPPDGPPPAHLRTPSMGGNTVLPPPLPARTQSTLANGEDPLALLREVDTVFLIDDSASMAGENWEQAKTALKGVADIAATYDEDGIEVYFLNSKRVGKELRNGADVEELFEGLVPKGATPTGARLDAILSQYVTRLEKSRQYRDEELKPLNLIVVTDGSFAMPVLARSRYLASNPGFDRSQVLDSALSDDPEVVLVSIAKRLDNGGFPASQVGVQFLQIGDLPEAKQALQDLDDGLSQAHEVRDIVDTVLFAGEAITASYVIKTLLGGINKRLDRHDS